MTTSSPPLSDARLGIVAVRDRAPLLPKVAFVLIGVASLLGTALTNRGLGVPLSLLLPRWLSLWSAAAALGFVMWRLVYLRRRELDVAASELADYHAGTLHRATLVGRVLAALSVSSIPMVMMVEHVEARPELRLLLLVIAAGLIVSLTLGPARRDVALVAGVAALGLLVGWAVADAGVGTAGLIRALHLVAFGLWVGGALWNLTVAIPVGVGHPNIAAVTAGAYQLQRFRRVARVSLPTVIVTGVVMASPYLSSIADLFFTVSGRFIAAKGGLIVALVVIFITCPLYRQCSPVAGVCDLDEVHGRDASPSAVQDEA